MIFEIKKYYSTFYTIKVEANTESEAIEKSKSIPLDENEIFNNLLEWEEADEIERFEYHENGKQT